MNPTQRHDGMPARLHVAPSCQQLANAALRAWGVRIGCVNDTRMTAVFQIKKTFALAPRMHNNCLRGILVHRGSRCQIWKPLERLNRAVHSRRRESSLSRDPLQGYRPVRTSLVVGNSTPDSGYQP